MRALGITILALGLAGCGLEEGDSCRAGQGECAGADEGIFCIDGTARRLSCDGPAGCSGNFLRSVCDQSVADEGAVCAQNDTAACTPDRSTFLECRGHRYESVAACRGPRACFREGDRVMCDESLGAVGEPCSSEDGGHACSVDGGQMLRCVAARWQVVGVCRGPQRCHTQGQTVYCDHSVGRPGEPCTGAGGTCTEDGATYLTCQNGSFVTVSSCRGERGCRIEGDQVRCDSGRANVGEPCTGEGAACDMEGRAMLACQNDTFTQTRRCPGGCVVDGTTVRCR